MASGFAIEGIRFAVKNPTAQAPKKEALLEKEYDPNVHDDDREFSAILSAGTKYGSR